MTQVKPTEMEKFDLHQLMRKNIADLQPYSSARDEYQTKGQEMVFLDANENPFGNGINRYPDSHQSKLKAALAAQKNLDSEQLLLGNGSDEVLDFLFRAFCEPGEDNIITLPPTYGMYRVLANLNNVEEREVLLSRNFEPNVPGIFEKLDRKTKIIFLCSPNNPTGNSFSETAITEILENFKGLVVIDEAYIDFSAQRSWLQRLQDYPNLVITQTFSKAYGMAGLRLGICYASKEIIAVLDKIKPPYNVNSLTQSMATDGILHKKKQLQEEIQMLLEERRKLEEEFRKVKFMEAIFPSDANFLLVKVDDANRRYRQLLQNGIVVRNRTSQPLCENTLRFSIGTRDENRKLVDALLKLDQEVK